MHYMQLAVLFALVLYQVSSSACPVVDKACRCFLKYSREHYLTCQGLGVVSVVPEFLSSATAFVDITIRDSRVDGVQASAFAGLSTESLKLQRLSIKTMHPKSLMGMDALRLQEIHLDDNLLSVLPDDLLIGLTSLQYLGLHNNRLLQLPESLLTDASALISLSVFNNQISTLQSGMFSNCHSLRILKLFRNNLSSLDPNVFAGLTTLSELNLANNELTSLPPGLLLNLTSLIFLDLASNHLTNLPDDLLNNHADLEKLDLSGNQLTSVGVGLLVNTPKISSIDFSDNLLTTLLSEDLTPCKRLKKIYLSGNRLTSLQEGSISGFALLTHLHLEHNQLQNIDAKSISNLTKLEYLNLQNNSISNMDPEFFTGMPNVHYLILSDNLFTSLLKGTSGIFKNLANLRKLFLSGNKIQTLTEGSFDGLSLLETLELQVPKYLSEVWNEAKPSSSVGTLTITNVPNTKTKVMYTLNEELSKAPKKPPFTENTIPPEHSFVLTSIAKENRYVMSHEQKASDMDTDKLLINAKVSIEGKIMQRAECRPFSDINYMSLKRTQIETVNKPSRKMQTLDNVVTNKPVVAHASTIANMNRKKEMGKKSRLDKNMVMNMVFAAFEKHQYYNIRDLENITRQPKAYLKELLNEFCNYNIKKPHRNMWELKPEFRHYKAKEDDDITDK